MPGGRATNLYSPCPPVTMERSSFDSLLEIATLAPLMALPLGSVTVPWSELDEDCATAVPANTAIWTIHKTANRSTDFMCGPPGWNLLSNQAERIALGRYSCCVFLMSKSCPDAQTAGRHNTRRRGIFACLEMTTDLSYSDLLCRGAVRFALMSSQPDSIGFGVRRDVEERRFSASRNGPRSARASEC